MSSRCLRSLLLVLPLLAIACGDDSNGRLAPQLTAPTVREVQPTAGPVAGNTLVNVYGSGFQDGARVFLGNLELQRTVVVNAFRIYGYTPTATSGRMDVRVLNPDGAYGLLVKGFTFEGPPSPTIAQAEVITGNSEAVSRGPPVGVTVRGAVTVPGVTRGVGQGGGVRAQVGFAPGDSDVLNAESYTWEDATYETDSGSGEADVYMGNVLLQAPIGGANREWVVSVRFSIDAGKTWVMADGDGSANGLSVAMTRRVFIARPRVDYCKLGPDRNNANPDFFYLPGDAASHKVVGQAFSADITPGNGPGSGLKAQLGYGPEDADPRDSSAWTWVDATYKAQHGDNDEWEATLPNPKTLGTYRIAFRFSISENAWRVCDADGTNDSTTGELTFSLQKLGRLVVATTPPKPPVSWCKIGEDQTAPPAVSYITTQTEGLQTLYAQVHMPGVTDKQGAGEKLEGQIGWGPADEDPRESPQWNWSAQLEFNKDNFEVNDEWKGTLPNPTVTGAYRYAVRFRVDGGPLRVCDGNGTDDGGQDFEMEQLGQLTVTGPPVPPTVVGYCKLGPDGSPTPETVTYTTTATANRKVVAQVYVLGATPGNGVGAGVVGQLGWGPAGVDPTTSDQWNWTTEAAYKNDLSNNDEYDVTLPNPGVAGTYRFAYRFQVNGGAFLYCDADGNGGDGTFDPAKTGTLNVVAPPTTVGYCKLGPDGNTNPETVTYTPTMTADRKVVAQVYVEGVTPGSGMGAGVVGQLGWGPAGSDPRTSGQWSWSDAQFKNDLSNNDEYDATLPNPGTAGTYRFAYRFQVNGGDFLYCDSDGNTGADGGFDLARMGTLTVATTLPKPPVAWCKLGEDQTAPPSVSYVTTQTSGLQTIYAQVGMPGVTNRPGAGPGLTGQLGWGPVDTDPSTSNQWNWSTQLEFNKDNFEVNDEWRATLPNPGTNGQYRYAVRFSVDDGPVRVCDGNGSDDGNPVEQNQLGQLTVTGEVVAPTVVGYCKLGPDGNDEQDSVTYLTTATGDHQVVAQVYVQGVTNSTGAGAGIVGQLGWGPVGSDPTTSGQWNWATEGTYKGEVGDNDEFEATLPNPGMVGGYRFVYRFQVNGGAFLYCDSDGNTGAAGGFDAARMGTLNVATELPRPRVTWCKLGENDRPPEAITYLTSQATDLKRVYAQVHMPGVTDKAGAGADLAGQLGWGPVGEDPQSSPQWNWSTSLVFNKDNFWVNDEWMATLPNPGTNGQYRYAVRFSVSGGPFRVCDGNGVDDNGQTFEQDQLGQLTVTGEVVPPTDIGYCKLGPDANNTPETVTYATAGPADHTVVAQVYVGGVTPGTGAGSGVVAQLGWGPAGEDPTTSSQWHWTAGTYKGEVGNNDEFEATLPNPGVAGTFRFAYRFQANGGAFLYCDADGNTGAAGGFDAALTGTLTVEGPPVPPAVCRLVSVSGTTVGSGDAVTAVGTVRVPGVTDGETPPANLQVQVGVGAANVNAATEPAAFTWKDATGSRQAESDATADEFSFEFHPAYTGDRMVSMRYSLDGTNWTYCDKDGSDVGEYTTGQQHALTVGNPSGPNILDYCKLQHPFRTSHTDFNRTTYGRFYEAGVTNATEPHPEIVAELGAGPVRQDPGVSQEWTWISGTFTTRVDGNHEYQAAVPQIVPTGFYYLWRFRMGSGPYCYGDWQPDGVAGGSANGANPEWLDQVDT